MTLIKYMSVMTTFSVFAALFSIIYKAFLSLRHLNKLTSILTGMLALENAIINRTILDAGTIQQRVIDIKPRIAVGYGSCMDLIIQATSFLNYSDVALTVYDNFTVDDISNEKEFIQSFSYYFRKGAAAERFISDDKLFKKLIDTIKEKHSDSIVWSLGGNAPIMSTRFFKEGAEVLLAARMSPKLKNFLPSGIKLAGDLVDDDDIHLILEYKSGEKWGPFTAPRANRYILHNDQNNPKINSLELFDRILKDFKPRLLVVSGLQMMDSHKFAKGVRELRLEKVQKQISSQLKTTLVHFEMASFVELKLLQLLSKHIIPYVDSIGMNEQELDNLQQFFEFERIKFSSDSNPRVAIALDQMRKLFKLINHNYFINKNVDSKIRMLTRLHVHTLAYQAILIVKNSQWNYAKNAAAKAALTAYRHVCQSDIINPESATLILDESFSTSLDENFAENNGIPQRIVIDPVTPISCWNESISITNQIIHYEICIAPVLVCRTAKVTAGAGDNISASGLFLQI